MFDFSPLSPSIVFGAGAALTAAWLSFAWLVNAPQGFLRTVRKSGGVVTSEKAQRSQGLKKQIYFGGSVLIMVSVLVAFFYALTFKLWLGIALCALLTILVGVADEQYSLRPGTQLFWQLVIAVLAVSFGWTIRYVSHPLADGVIQLDQISVGSFVLPGSLLAIVWLLLLMNAMNWLDGVDGLAAGVGVLALVTLGLISLLPEVQDAHTLSLAAIGGGSLLAFFFWNVPPARVYLGTSGSWFLGWYIGLVAMAGGGKIATTLLVLSWPVIDLVIVAVGRVLAGQAPWRGDTTHHLHYRLRATGISDKWIIALAVSISAGLGILAVALQTQHKILVLTIIAITFVVITLRLLRKSGN